MSEWWTYGLEDFLMFSPATYWRLVAQYHQSVWPGQLLMLVVAGALTVMIRATARLAARTVLVVLAGLWLWVAWAFFLDRYAGITWAANYLAGAFGLQAALLMAAALTLDDQRSPGWGRGSAIGWMLVVVGLILFPVASFIAGTGWSQTLVFGIDPEPTALASAGFVWALNHTLTRRWRIALSVIPVALLLASGATYWALASASAGG
jgi:Family of unknown function (DUF6064)